MDDLIYSKSKPLCSTNIWVDDIDNEVNDPHPIIYVTNTINIEHYDLWFDFVIQSCNGLNQKSQFLEDEISQNHHIPWWWKNLNIVVYLDN